MGQSKSENSLKVAKMLAKKMAECIPQRDQKETVVFDDWDNLTDDMKRGKLK